MSHECPVDGCGAAFGSSGSLKGHITRKADDSHQGLSGPEVVDGEQTVDETRDSDETTESKTVDERVLSFPENPDSESNSETSHDLPCGHDSFKESDAPDPPFRVACDDCGETWVVNS